MKLGVKSLPEMVQAVWGDGGTAARAPGAEFEANASCLPLLLTARCHPRLRGHPGPGFQRAMWLSGGCTPVFMHICVHVTLCNCNCRFANSAGKCMSSHKSRPPAPPLSLRSLPFPRLEDQAHPLLSKAAFSLFAGPQPSQGLQLLRPRWSSLFVMFSISFHWLRPLPTTILRHPLTLESTAFLTLLLSGSLLTSCTHPYPVTPSFPVEFLRMASTGLFSMHPFLSPNQRPLSFVLSLDFDLSLHPCCHRSCYPDDLSSPARRVFLNPATWS